MKIGPDLLILRSADPTAPLMTYVVIILDIIPIVLIGCVMFVPKR